MRTLKNKKMLEELSSVNKPIENEKVYCEEEEKYYVFKDGIWTDPVEVNIGYSMFELNRDIISQLEPQDIEESRKEIQKFNNIHKNRKFFILFGKEISYITIFYRDNKGEIFSNEVIDCLKSLGTIQAVDYEEETKGIEIWIKPFEDEDLQFLSLFPADAAAIPIQ